MSHVLGWVPSFFSFSYFQIQEQELSFNYDSSSSFLTFNMKLHTFTDNIYFPIGFYFCDFISCDFFPATFSVTLFP